MALIDFDYARLRILRFHSRKDDFTCLICKVERVFTCCNLDEQEKFKVVISRLRGCALQWWHNYKIKRIKKGKEKVRTWKKMTSKLIGAFCLTACMLNHVSLLPEKKDSKSVCVGYFFNMRSSFRPAKPTLLALSTL